MFTVHPPAVLLGAWLGRPIRLLLLASAAAWTVLGRELSAKPKVIDLLTYSDSRVRPDPRWTCLFLNP